MRLIDADRLEKAVYEHRCTYCHKEDVIAAIAKQPTVDAVEVVHGRWVKGGYVCGETEWKCSICNETEWRTSADRLSYCPFCGAKMDGEDHG